jgi:DNA polymerase-3 subunit alpha
LIGVTKVDPIVRELYFERFISYSRAKTNVINGVRWLTNCPDIDCDFSEGGRTAVIEYLSEKYKGRFVKLSTYGTGVTKALLKDTGKIIANYSEDNLKAVSDAIPKKFGRVASPEASYEEAPLFKDFCDKNPLAYKAMVKLQGIIKNQGTHASAFLLSHDPLDTFMPIESRYNNKNKAFELSTSCDMTVSESMAVKLDILGLKTVEILDNVIKKVGEDREKIDYESWDDIYVHLQKLETPSNLFQISGDGASAGLNKIRPRSLEHLAAVLAICRPGSFVFIDQYADYINGAGDRPNLHPLFDDILEKTGFVVLYQESLMAMGVKLGLTLSEADDLRKVTSKKRADEIDAWEEKIYKVAKENGHDEEAARAFFAVAKASADYSFNKCAGKDTVVISDSGPKKIKYVKIGDKVKALNTATEDEHFVEVLDVQRAEAELYEVVLENGDKIHCSLDHKWLCEDKKMRTVKEIFKKEKRIIQI